MAASTKGCRVKWRRALQRPAVAHSYRRERATTISPVLKRLIRAEDIEWMLALAKRRYSNRWDFEAAQQWFENVALRQPLVFYPIRSDNAFVVTLISIIPWMPAEWEANVVWCCAEEGCMWEALALLRESVAWAKRRKCVEWRFRTETDFDVGPLARRLGATEIPPCFMVKL